MKRSQAKNIIQDYLNKNDVEEVNADRILILVEEIGMLPPFSEKHYMENYITTNGGYEWEDENE